LTFNKIPPEKASDAFKKQLEVLHALKGMDNFLLAKEERIKWDHATHSLIEDTFGSISSELQRFNTAKRVGSFSAYSDTNQERNNFRRQLIELEGLLKGIINSLSYQTPEKEIKGTYSSGEAYSFYIDLSKLIMEAKKIVMFIDPYINEEVFNLYVSKIRDNCDVYILTNKDNIGKDSLGATLGVAKRYSQQNKFFKMRSTKKIHDRVVLIDDRIWFVGQSIKDAAKNKPTFMVELSALMVSSTKNDYNKIWNDASNMIE
jgi:hypothetical protein